MNTCSSCFYCVPNFSGGMGRFYQGTCYQASRIVQANMTACSIYKERGENVVVKSTPDNRNTYKDKEGNKIPGMTLTEVVGYPLTIIAKRNYVWGKYAGLAVKIANPEGKLAIIEITAKTPIKALCMPDLPKPPYEARFIQKTSKNGRKYYTIEVIKPNEDTMQDDETDLPY